MPLIALSAARDNDVAQVNPGLSDQLSLLVVIKHRHFQLVVIRGVVDNESELLVPVENNTRLAFSLSSKCRPDVDADLPLWCLSTTDVSGCLLCLFPQTRSAVGILLPNGLPVGQVLRPINNKDQRADLRAIDRHVRKDARGVHPVERVGFRFGGHPECRSCAAPGCLRA